MRSDMAKVLVERPRPGSRDGSRPVKGYRKRLQRSMADENSPGFREAMLARHRGHERFFNENLAPLRRFVESRLGRPWNTIYAELCERIDRGNVVQKHILTHLDDFVLRHVIVIDGQPCFADSRLYWGRFYGQPLRDMALRQLGYICPQSGLLKRIPTRLKRPAAQRLPRPAFIRVSDQLQCRFIDGQWELIALAPLPPELARKRSVTRDVVLDRPVPELDPVLVRRTYGAVVYATARRILRKQEQKQFPIPFDLIS